MALKVRTTHGKVFRRCGMTFDDKWKKVEDADLDQLFASPGPAKKGKHPTVREILMNDKMLVCVEAGKGNGK